MLLKLVQDIFCAYSQLLLSHRSSSATQLIVDFSYAHTDVEFSLGDINKSYFDISFAISWFSASVSVFLRRKYGVQP